MTSLGRILSFAAVTFAIAAALIIVLSVQEAAINSYNGEISFSATKISPSYDYSCDEPVQGIYLVISNDGPKAVSDFSVSISSPLCTGSVPTLPKILGPQSSIKFYIYSSKTNGTVTIQGNDTLLIVKF
ncbi:MAG TPA: hypothetical protein VFF30_19850 [Nitrososphaerales archaeon]|nr:hypothetical protein [Nitrososphaerales archaeon]